jgi:hypothetical protein
LGIPPETCCPGLEHRKSNHIPPACCKLNPGNGVAGSVFLSKIHRSRPHPDITCRINSSPGRAPGQLFLPTQLTSSCSGQSQSSVTTNQQVQAGGQSLLGLRTERELNSRETTRSFLGDTKVGRRATSHLMEPRTTFHPLTSASSLIHSYFFWRWSKSGAIRNLGIISRPELLNSTFTHFLSHSLSVSCAIIGVQQPP